MSNRVLCQGATQRGQVVTRTEHLHSAVAVRHVSVLARVAQVAALVRVRTQPILQAVAVVVRARMNVPVVAGCDLLPLLATKILIIFVCAN